MTSCESESHYHRTLHSCLTPFAPATRSRDHNFSRQAMIDEFDMDQDGEINEQEFFSIMTDDA